MFQHHNVKCHTLTHSIMVFPFVIILNQIENNNLKQIITLRFYSTYMNAYIMITNLIYVQPFNIPRSTRCMRNSCRNLAQTNWCLFHFTHAFWERIFSLISPCWRSLYTKIKNILSVSFLVDVVQICSAYIYLTWSIEKYCIDIYVWWY